MIELHLKKKIFNEAYFPYLVDYSHKYEVYYGGSGSGKSHFIAMKILYKALSSKRKVLIIRKTMASQKESCWSLMLKVLSDWQILEYCEVNKSDFAITLPNKSKFIFKGLDDSEKIKSIVGITDCWCEECTELNQEDFDQLTLRVRARVDNIQFFCSFNPVSKANWVYKRWFSGEVPEDTFVLRTTYKDNRFLPQDYIKTLEETIKTNPVYYKIYALGEFCSLEKTVFTNWEVKELPDFVFDEAIFGLDFGYVNDPSAFVAAKVNTEAKEIYIYDELYERALVNSDIAQWIKHKGYSKEVIIADCAEQKSIDEIKRLGISRIKPCWKGAGSIMTGIDLLKQYKLYISPKCENMITELQNYTWKKDRQTGEYINEPSDDFNHLCDALRYAIQSICNNTKLKTLDKSVFGL